MNDAFREVTGRDEWKRLISGAPPFWDDAWEAVLAAAFPYVAFRRFVYRGTHAVRLAEIGGRLTTVPFSDGGDVVALGADPLPLASFAADALDRFGAAFTVRAHESFAPVAADGTADIIDYRIALAGFGIDSIRKTLRHIVAPGVPEGASIRRATAADGDRAYALYLSTMSDAGGLALPRPAFDAAFARDAFVFEQEGIITGIGIFFSDDRRAHHFISAADGAGKRANAPHHILFYAIGEYKKAEKEFVFLGGTSADSTLRTFKEGWRGEPCGLYTVRGSSSHEAARRSPLRELWKLIPASLLPKATELVGKRVF